MRLKIASRKSDLARLQAYRVKEALLHVDPTLEIEFQFRESLGDKNLVDPLWKSPEKGVFTEDFLQDLISGHTDLVVHSWKDLPTFDKPITEIAATLPRADLRDLLLLKKNSLGKTSLQILSSSPRRAYNLEHLGELLPNNPSKIDFQNVRGNIQTRVRKLLEIESADGLILAKAAMDRLLEAKETDLQETRQFLRDALRDLNFMILPLSLNPPAAAQGALAIEIRSDRTDLKKLLSNINHSPTYQAVQFEREILKSYGGGCHQKIGVGLIPIKHGWAYFLRGKTDQGQVLSTQRFHKSIDTVTQHEVSPATHDWSSKLLSDQAKRQNLELENKDLPKFLYVTKTPALPETFKQNGHFLWTAGVSTWKKLAKKGFWITGCSDGLGEDLPTLMSPLLNDFTGWTRLSHKAAPSSLNGEFCHHIPTYQIQLETDWSQLKKYQSLFWTSAYFFKLAIENEPSLLKSKHYCGPGRTFDEIKLFLSSRNLANQVSLNVDHYRPKQGSLL